MTRAPTPQTARRLVESYDPAFRASLVISTENADNTEALLAAAEALPPDASALLDLLIWVSQPGEVLPERLRPLIEREGLPLWRAALLLPRASQYSGADIHPIHYAGSCRLNIAIRGHRPVGWDLVTPEMVPSFPPSDARWDAVVVAALLESGGGQLTMDGVLRKDVERRMFSSLGGDPARWGLALQVARLTGLARPAEGRLRGLPEAVARPLGDPASLFSDPAQSAAATLMLRLQPAGQWMDVPAVLTRLRDRCRQILFSPIDGRYPERSDLPFDLAGWEHVERPLFLSVLDTLHRVGVIDAARVGAEIRAVRPAGPRPSFAHGFLLTPDNDILVHSGELSGPDYGRLARMAPYVDGERVHRHRLTREGVGADLAAGNRDALEFLAEHSRTGLPGNIADTVREWQRSATRVTILSGVDIEEGPDGRLRVLNGPPPATARIIDYAQPPRARFLYRRGRIYIPDGWDALTVRAAVERVARPAGREGEDRVYVPERRPQPDAVSLLARLQEHYGGELPGEIEALILSGMPLEPARCESAWIVHLPAEAAAAVRRDWVAGPMLRRIVSPTEVVVAGEDLPRLRARLEELGIRWE